MEDLERYKQEASMASMAYAASCAEKDLTELEEKAVEARNTLYEISAMLNNKIREAQEIAETINMFKEK